MLKKVPELARTTANLYNRCDSVSPTSRIKLNTKKRNLFPVNFAFLVCSDNFWKSPCSIFLNVTDAEVTIKSP